MESGRKTSERYELDGDETERTCLLEDSGRATESECQDMGSEISSQYTHENDHDLYSYSPLMNDEIRLLRISPSKDKTGLLQADLVHVGIQSATNRQFTALSYTWGLQRATSTILVNQEIFYVRPNLATILHKMHAAGKDLLWVRVLCCRVAPIFGIC